MVRGIGEGKGDDGNVAGITGDGVFGQESVDNPLLPSGTLYKYIIYIYIHVYCVYTPNYPYRQAVNPFDSSSLADHPSHRSLPLKLTRAHTHIIYISTLCAI